MPAFELYNIIFPIYWSSVYCLYRHGNFVIIMNLKLIVFILYTRRNHEIRLIRICYSEIVPQYY